MHIISLGMHITDQCNARCQHCAYHCGPEVKGVMSLEDASEYLRQVTDQPLGLVCISGGEPCLYFDLVVQIAQEAQAMGPCNIWVFTNAYWAVSPAVARNKLARLKEAGATQLCLSADAFHQAFIPIRRVLNAINAARDLGLEIVLDVRFLGSPNEDNPTNRITWQILEQLGNLEDIEVLQGRPLYIGRAADALLSESVQRPGIPADRCPGPWAGGTWEDPAGVDVDSYGEVTLCPGISIGNAKKSSLNRILAEYDPQQHPIIKELKAGGPAKLAQMAKRMGYIPRTAYVDECHLCYDVRKFLLQRYPRELAPAICYG